MGNVISGTRKSFSKFLQKAHVRDRKRSRSESESSTESVDSIEERIVKKMNNNTIARSPGVDLDSFNNSKKGFIFNNRYVVMDLLGAGTFGKVYRVRDMYWKKEFAMKTAKYKKEDGFEPDSVKKEAQLLKKMMKVNTRGLHPIVMYHDDFPSNLGHCLVMEVLKMNLHEFAQRSRSGLPAGAIAISETRLVAFQLFVALEFLEKHKIVHCDLKPHNVMVSNLNPLRIKVIDFGSAESTNTLDRYTYFQTRFYRSPEVILGAPLTPAVDVWSVACILAEIHAGDILFYGENQFDQIREIVKVLGIPPVSVLTQAQFTYKFFRTFPTVTLIPGNRLPVIPGSKSLVNFLLSSKFDDSDSDESEAEASSKPFDAAQEKQLSGLIQAMLVYEPEKRIKPEKAKSHAFFDCLDKKMRTEIY